MRPRADHGLITIVEEAKDLWQSNEALELWVAAGPLRVDAECAVRRDRGCKQCRILARAAGKLLWVGNSFPAALDLFRGGELV